MEDWINRMRSSHTMEYFLPRNAMKLIHATTWMKLTLGEICQTEKDKWCMIPLIRGTQTRQIHRQKVMVVAGAGGVEKGDGELCLSDTVSVLQGERSPVTGRW